jgi:hypothetical protein
MNSLLSISMRESDTAERLQVTYTFERMQRSAPKKAKRDGNLVVSQ